MIEFILGIIIVIIKWVVMLGLCFYWPIVVGHITEDNKKLGTILYIGGMILIMIAIFWNIEINPVRAWNPYYQ